MSRSNSGGLLEAIIELAVAIAVLLCVLYWVYWAWVHYWGWIVGGAVVIVGIFVFIRWIRSRDNGW